MMTRRLMERPIEGLDAVTQRIEREVERGRLGLAYHIALSTPEALPSANAIKLIACNYLADGQIPADLPDFAGKLLREAKHFTNDEMDRETLLNYAVLLTSAALKPSLTVLAGRTEVARLLSSLEGCLAETPSLRALAKDATKVSGMWIPVELLREDDSQMDWSEEMRMLRDRAERWRDNEKDGKLKYQPATAVWREMLKVWKTEIELRSDGWSSCWWTSLTTLTTTTTSKSIECLKLPSTGARTRIRRLTEQIAICAVRP